jgi:hypothetical protein
VVFQRLYIKESILRGVTLTSARGHKRGARKGDL